MAKAKGIQRFDAFKLGKAPAKRDKRNLKFAALLRVPVKLPRKYDFDAKNPRVPTPMFDNDRWGNCVIAGRAHQSLRFELIEQKKVLRISTRTVNDEYFRQTGGEDSGLVVLDSLKLWRKVGWKVSGLTLKVQSFSQLTRTDHEQVRQAIYLDIGVGIGLALPTSAEKQCEDGEVWDVVSGIKGRRNSWGGHYVYVSGYTADGPVCVTWGKKQLMTWAFFDRYCDEAYAIIDALNTTKLKKAIDSVKLLAFLAKH